MSPIKSIDDMDEMSKRILASSLRRRLQGRVAVHILENLSDDLLIQNYFADHQAKMDHLAEKNESADDEPRT